MQRSDPVTHAKPNLHSAEAALVTARQRLSDAVIRFSDDFGCSRSFAALVAPHESLGWWTAQAEYAERPLSAPRTISRGQFIEHKEFNADGFGNRDAPAYCAGRK
jgi:hypothetical protein